MSSSRPTKRIIQRSESEEEEYAVSSGEEEEVQEKELSQSKVRSPSSSSVRRVTTDRSSSNRNGTFSMFPILSMLLLAFLIGLILPFDLVRSSSLVQRLFPTSFTASSSTGFLTTSSSSTLRIGGSTYSITSPPLMNNPIHLKVIHNFLTHEECAYLRAIANGLYNRSEAGEGINPIRTSFTAFLDRGRVNNDTIISGIENKISKLVRMPLSHMEELHVVRYEPGQKYGLHYDDDLGEPNPRRYTVLAYLNDLDIDDGGETHFPELDYSVTPQKGSAAVWRNFNAERRQLIHSEHQGMPPVRGVKYAMNSWIHFDPIIDEKGEEIVYAKENEESQEEEAEDASSQANDAGEEEPAEPEEAVEEETEPESEEGEEQTSQDTTKQDSQAQKAQ